MRILHTSDWHLGQTLRDSDRTYEHEQFLQWLLDTLVRENVDALLIAGDVFDTANPSATALGQFYRFLAAARGRFPRLETIVIGGNHDSAGRLEAPTPLLESLGVTVVGQTHRTRDGQIDLERLVVPIHGADEKPAAWVLAIPFLRPGDVPRTAQEGDPFANGVTTLYRQALDLALASRRPNEPILAMGHCHMVGGQTSEESERRIVIGGTEALSAAMFDPGIAYVALGHLHLAQKVGASEHIRYSGSPLPMSFSEIHYQHGVLVIDFEGEKRTAIRTIRTPRAVELLRVPEQPAPLAEVLDALRNLKIAAHSDETRPYLEVCVKLNGPEPGLRAQVEEALEGKPVRLLKITPVRAGQDGDRGAAAAPLSLDAVKNLRPEAVFEQLLQRSFVGEVPGELKACFAELLAAGSEEVTS